MPSEYPEKPKSLSLDSVATYLAEFETAFARNRVVDEMTVKSVKVEIQGEFDGSETGAGFVASSNVQVMYTMDTNDTETALGDIEYAANYYVDSELVYRIQTDTETVDPRDGGSKRLVQCGSSS